MKTIRISTHSLNQLPTSMLNQVLNTRFFNLFRELFQKLLSNTQAADLSYDFFN